MYGKRHGMYNFCYMTGYIVGMIFGSIAIVCALVFLIIFFSKKRFAEKLVRQIGRTSEELINKDIQSWAKITKNKFINSSLFKYDNDKFFEVDSILITDKAVIVIEIKSIKGGVSGDAHAETWTKTLGENKFPLTNPIKQNDRHIAHIESMTKIKVPTISLIIYSNRALTLDVKNLPTYAAVIRHAELFDSLDSINNSLPVKISDEEMKMIDKEIRKNITNSKEDIRRFNEIVKGAK